MARTKRPASVTEGAMPSRASGMVKKASGVPITMSQQAASAMPPWNEWCVIVETSARAIISATRK